MHCEMSAKDPKRTYWRQVSVIFRTLFSRVLDFLVGRLETTLSLHCAPQTYPKAGTKLLRLSRPVDGIMNGAAVPHDIP